MAVVLFYCFGQFEAFGAPPKKQISTHGGAANARNFNRTASKSQDVARLFSPGDFTTNRFMKPRTTDKSRDRERRLAIGFLTPRFESLERRLLLTASLDDASESGVLANAET